MSGKYGETVKPTLREPKPHLPVRSFSPADCRYPERILSERRGVTVGLGPRGVEHYALYNGLIFRVAEPGEEPEAIFPKATEAHPYGVPLIRVVVRDFAQSERRLQALSAAIERERLQHRCGPECWLCAELAELEALALDLAPRDGSPASSQPEPPPNS